MDKVRLECKLERLPRGIFVIIYVNGEKLGFCNIGGEIDKLIGRPWNKKRVKGGYLLWMEFEADVERKIEKSRSGYDEVEHIYLRNIR